MGKIVSFINRKGGVGKTTITVNLGGYLAVSLNKKVLIVDLDPQASASSWLMTQELYLERVVNFPGNPINSSYQIFRDALFYENYYNKEIGIQKGVVKDKKGTILTPTLDLIPSNTQLDNLEREIVNYYDLKLAIFHEALLKHDIVNDYDYILIDCPPNMGSASQNALFASDAFVIPIIPDPLSFQGFPELINTASLTLQIADRRRDDHKKPYCAGLILSHFKNTRACKKTREDIKSLLTIHKDEGKIDEKADIFLTKITYKTAIPDAQGQGAILATTTKRSDSQTEFENLAIEFDRKLSN